jgi:branched-chain amino acid transport system permease protein
VTVARRARPAWLPDVLTLAGLVVAPWILPPLGFAPDTINRILMWGLLGIGFDLLFGFVGLLSFGQSAFFGTGGFVAAYLLTTPILSNVVASLLIGTVVAAAAGVLVGLIALRRTGIYFAMITVAIAETFFFVENSPLSDYTGGENGLPGVPRPDFSFAGFDLRMESQWALYPFMAGCFFIGIVLARRIVRSPVGAILVAIRENPLRARALGHKINRYKLTAFVVAAAYAGFAGGLLGVLQGYMPPEAFTFDTSGQLVMQTVIGGAGTLLGPLVGAAVWLYLRDFLQDGLHLGAAWKLVLGLVFVLLVCFLRRGIIGGIADVVSRARRGPAVDPVPAPATSWQPAIRPARAVRADEGTGFVLEARDLTKRYGGLTANSGISLQVKRGELRGIIGPNGAGKSTLFKMLTCEVVPSEGKIFFQGREITGRDVCDVCQTGLTKSYQVNQLFEKLTVGQNMTIAALAKLRGDFRLDLLRRTDRVPGLAALIDETLHLVHLRDRRDTPVAELAYGEKRRLEIGLALASDPSLLLLDEPLAGMSPRERTDTVALLKAIARDRTMIVIEHDMDAMFALAQTISVLHEGKLLAEGTPAELQRNSFVQEAYLGGIAAE